MKPMANVTIEPGGTGTCQYCAEAPATLLINSEWNACQGCADRVKSGTEDVGYEVYCAFTALKSCGTTYCHECDAPISECDCIHQEVYEAHRNDLPVVPPGRHGALVGIDIAKGPDHSAVLTVEDVARVVQVPADLLGAPGSVATIRPPASLTAGLRDVHRQIVAEVEAGTRPACDACEQDDPEACDRCPHKEKDGDL